MEITPQIYTARVMHKRLFPRVNQFTYGVYYLALPLHWLQEESTDSLPVNRRGLISFHEQDHGLKDGSSLEPWLREILTSYGLNARVASIQLVAMPRIFGYVFNPVSFWLCRDADGKLRAVLCEVNNTFGETHSYLCAHADHRPITGNDWLSAQKLFHVSPFLPVEGRYQFRFADNDEKLGIWIDYYDAQENKQLVTALTGQLQPLTKKNLQRIFWRHPLVTFKVIGLIHWQALKLVSKRIRYICKPPQKPQTLSGSDGLTKM